MKVLMFSWEYPPHVVGGLGKHVMELAPELDAAGIEVHLVTPRWLGGAAEEAIGTSVSGSRVYRVDPPTGVAPDFFTGAIRANQVLEDFGRQLIARLGGFDLIHVHDWLVAFSGVALKHEDKIPLLSTIHATEYGRGRGEVLGDGPQQINQAEWRLTYESWRVICCSGFMAREINTALRTPFDKIDVIPNGVDTTRFDRLEGVDLTAFRRGFALPTERIIFSVGRVVAEKGLHLLVEAMPAILATFPQTKLVVAGTGGHLGYCRDRATALGIAPSCYFTGFIADDDRDRLFKVADVAVFPSLYEPFGIVALEAMAAKTPVVVAEVGGLIDVVRHAETGITVLPNSPASIAWGVLHTLENPVWARQRADTAYRVAREEFNWGEIARLTIGVYQRIADERSTTVWA